jgi:hypothetical protein
MIEISNTFRKIGEYEISNRCLQSYPCKHYIKLKNGNTKLMSGDKIYRLFKTEGLSDPHIDKYAEWVRQQDFPTLEEIMKKKNDPLRIQQDSEKRAKEEEEKQKIINQYKASSRIDKLKNKNNIK